MQARFARLISPTVFLHEPIENHLAYLLNILVPLACGTNLVGYLGAMLFYSFSTTAALYLSLSMLGLFLIWLTIRTGHARLAGVLFILFIWAQPSLAIMRSGGLHSPVLSTLLVFVYLAGLLLGWAGLAAGIVLNLVTCAAMFGLERFGFLPRTAAADSSLLNLIVFVTCLGAVVVVVYLSHRGQIRAFSLARREIAERRRTEEMVLTIARGVSAATGDSFFRSLVEQMGKALDADFTFIGEILDGGSKRIRTLAVYSEGRIIDNFEYVLGGSPCELILGRKHLSYPRGVRNIFPLDRMLDELKVEGWVGATLAGSSGEAFGIMAMLFRRPLENVPLAESLLQIFAARATSELDRKLSEDALQKSEERFRSLVHNSSDIITIHNSTGTLLYISGSGERILGYQPGALPGMNLFELVHTEDLSDAMRAFKNSLEAAGRENSVEFRIRRADGSWIYIESIISNQLENPAIRGIVATSRDITERRRAQRAEEEKLKLEDRLRQAHKMETIGQLAGGVAHDFNNLLSPILGYSELLMSDIRGDDPRYHRISVIKGAAERAANLTRQLLSFSRKQMLHMRTLDLNRILSEFERILRTTIREDVDLTIRLGQDLGYFSGDVSQVEQIILNLASNAQDALPSGGCMTIETSNVAADEAFCTRYPFVIPGNYVQLSFTDNGIGMGSETLKHIFEPFYTTKAMGKGTGLGLATVYGVVKQHRGYIFVSSAPERGTEFKVYLPRVDAPVETKPADTGISTEKTGTETIVVVEDNELVRDLASSVLKRSGYDVIVLPGAEECLELLEEQKPPIDLLLTDVVMPKINGRELYQRLSVQYPGLKVLFMSGYAGNVLSYHGVLDEGVNFIEKPFSVDALAGKVRELLEK